MSTGAQGRGFPKSIEEIAASLRYGIVRHDVGEHDMCVCSFCGQEGHNDQPGHKYSIKHWPHCPAKLYDDFTAK
jgi:hypothetical protein